MILNFTHMFKSPSTFCGPNLYDLWNANLCGCIIQLFQKERLYLPSMDTLRASNVAIGKSPKPGDL